MDKLSNLEKLLDKIKTLPIDDRDKLELVDLLTPLLIKKQTICED